MSAKSKIVFILILSIFATISASVVFNNSNSSSLIYTNQNAQAQQPPVAIEADIAANPERAKYKTIPLESIKSALQGSDPASLAMEAFDTNGIEHKPRKVEVAYPQPNQALVTITQNDLVKNSRDAVRYRVELSAFGRTILATSPPMWQIVWVGKRNSNEESRE
ncbi:hypothetical protein NIES2101_18170 [Calothrix sp. HK-06]|nr:hypothetical protein NIES2101_18170 [Calothrix sp. HK-06]